MAQVAAIGAVVGAVGQLGAAFAMDGEAADPELADQAKAEALGYLDQALRTSIPYSEYFTEQAIEAQKEQFGLAREDVKEYYERAMAHTAPYREAGYQALDTLQDTLGMARPGQGSSAMYHAMENKAKEDAARSRMGLAASRFASSAGMQGQDAMQFINAAQYGSNMPGLTRSLQEYRTGRGPLGETLKATDGMNPAEAAAAGGFESSRVGPGSEGYGNILEASSKRFNQDPYAKFMAEAAPLYSDINRSRMAMSSDQRALAQLGQTGYSHINPKVVDKI